MGRIFIKALLFYPKNKYLAVFTCCLFYTFDVDAQFTISGTIYDSTKLYGVSDVVITSNRGISTISDSLGGYHINVYDGDSISFYYNSRPTVKFAVAKIENQTQFDIALKVRVTSKYRPLKEIVVFTKSYQQQAEENRQEYSKIFNYRRPGLVSNTTPGTPPGLDVNELIRIFQFRKNKQKRAFRDRLIAEDEEKYIDSRFSSQLLRRITHLEGDSLQAYKRRFRPPYEVLVESDDFQFYTYILKTAAEFRKEDQR